MKLRVLLCLALVGCSTPSAPAASVDASAGEAGFDATPADTGQDTAKAEVAPPPEDFSKVLGWFESVYGAGGNRAKNVERAATLLDGTHIGPGETFSFNATVGPRTTARGFFVAPVIQDGEMVEGLGGGVCQASSTTHAAALMAGLDIVARTPHSRPSAYMPLGLDATVNFPPECGGDPNSTAKGCYALDLRVKNSSDKAVVIHTTTTVDPKIKSRATLRVEILGSVEVARPTYTYGAQTNGSYERRFKKVDGKPEGYHKRSQKGSDGLTVFSTLTSPASDGGVAAVRRYSSKYPPTDEVWEVSNDWPEDTLPWEAAQDAGVDAATDAAHD
jgi:hypothetical protein